MLTVEHLTAGYVADVDILEDVSLDVPEGQIVAVIGPNGAGKSTLLRAICGFLPLKQGEVRYRDQRLTGLPPSQMVNFGISYLPQERTVFPALSVERNLRLGGWAMRRDKARLQRAIDRVYAQFPLLLERRKSKAGDLSGGMQKMLEVARGLICEPQLVVVDEPSVGSGADCGQGDLRHFAPVARTASHDFTGGSKCPRGCCAGGLYLCARTRTQQRGWIASGVRNQPARHD